MLHVAELYQETPLLTVTHKTATKKRRELLWFWNWLPSWMKNVHKPAEASLKSDSFLWAFLASFAGLNESLSEL